MPKPPENYSATFDRPFASATPIVDAEAARAAVKTPQLRRPDQVVDFRSGLVVAFRGADLIAKIRDRAALYMREAEQAAADARELDAWEERGRKAHEDRTGIVDEAGPLPRALATRIDLAADLARSGRELLMIADHLEPGTQYEVTLNDLRNLGLFQPRLHL